MSEMVERVAAAVAGELYGDNETWKRAALAAIRAMREPTGEMAGNGADAADDLSHAGAASVWRAMIDEALQ